MQRLTRYLILCCFLLPLAALVANTPPPSISPLSLQRGWFTGLLKNGTEDVAARLTNIVSDLRKLEAQVPPEEFEGIHASINSVAANIEEVIALRRQSGKLIEEAPTEKAEYTLQDILKAADDVKSTEGQLEGLVEQVRVRQVTLEGMQRQIDRQYEAYAATAESSLQRTKAGLQIMVSVTTRAILQERVRILSEERASVDQRLTWRKETLSAAKEGLTIAGVNAAELSLKEQEAIAHQRKLEQAFLESELYSSPGVVSKQEHDYQLLRSVNKQILQARAQTEVLLLRAQQRIVDLWGPTPESAEPQTLFERLNESSITLGQIDKAATEWRRVVDLELERHGRLLFGEIDHTVEAVDQRWLQKYQEGVQDALANLTALEFEVFKCRQLVDLAVQKTVTQLGWVSGLWQRTYLFFKSVAESTYSWMLYPLSRLNETPVTLFSILRAVVIIWLTYLFSRFLRNLFAQFAKRRADISVSSVYTFNRVVHYVIVFAGFIIALGSIGIDFSSLLILAGALSVGIGFGLQGIVNNFLGGLIVLFDRKLRIGDFVELSGGETGHITEVNVQNTVIRTLTGHDILVPNSDIVSRQLINWTLRDQFARFHLPFGVAYGSDKEKVKEAVSAAARRIEETVTDHKTLPDPNVWLIGFGDSSLNFELVVWVDFRKTKKRQSSIRAAYYWEIETALNEANIEIPFPQRDLHLRSGHWVMKGGGDDRGA